jgi:hypothetical protein
MPTKKTAKKATSKVVTKTASTPKGPTLEERLAMPIEKAYPDAPGLWSSHGDKDPNFVTWLSKKHPKDYDARYKHRYTILDNREKESGPSLTKQCVNAQRQGYEDARSRLGYNADEHGYEGIVKHEYEVGYENGGGKL